jgi:hypothetical protein
VTRLALALAILGLGAECPVAPPAPKLHATKLTGGGFYVEAICPDGWHSHTTKPETEAYNKSNRDAAETINFLADATCVVKN